MSHTYKNIIFTNHAYERIKSRNISKHSIYETIKHPDKKKPIQNKKSGNSVKYIRRVKDRNYHVIATYKNDQKKHLVISAWVRGEEDKTPFIWQLITLPFKIAWWFIGLQVKIIWKLLKKLW